MDNLDHLKIESDADYIKNFGTNEVVIFSDRVSKINRHGYKQDRILILTSSNFYSFKKK